MKSSLLHVVFLLIVCDIGVNSHSQIVFPTSYTEELRGNNRRNPTGNTVYDFANNLYRTIASGKHRDENILLSPFSIRTILALLYLGSRGQTAEELKNVLNFPSDYFDLVDNYGSQLNTVSSSYLTEYRMCNGIFVKDSIALRQNYTNLLKERLKSDVFSSDFTDPAGSSRKINNYVSEATNGRIAKFATPSSISPQTSLYLVNALFYSGKWEKPFEPVKEESYFTTQSGRQVKVNMMRVESNFDYGYVKGLKSSAISIPFQDDRFTLLILKPQDGVSLHQVEALLSGYDLQKVAHEIDDNPSNVIVKMPKFKLSENLDLVNIMKSLGITNLFDSRKSDLSGMVNAGSRRNGGKERLGVNQMIHQAVLDVNEKGATGAAATSVGIYPISSPSFFTADRPFMFLLNDRLIGPVFIGRITDPSNILINDNSNHDPNTNLRRGSNRRPV